MINRGTLVPGGRAALVAFLMGVPAAAEPTFAAQDQQPSRQPLVQEASPVEAAAPTDDGPASQPGENSPWPEAFVNGDLRTQSFVHELESFSVVIDRELPLSQLVDLAAGTLRLNVDYDPRQLSATVSLRFLRGVTVRDLWAVVTEKLIERGLVAIEHGSGVGLTIVQLAAAKGAVPMQPTIPHGGASYARVLVPLEHRDPRQILDAISRGVLGTNVEVEALGGLSALVISGYVPALRAALPIVEGLDRDTRTDVLIEIQCRHCEAKEAADLVQKLLTQRGQQSTGAEIRVVARASTNTLVVSSDAAGIAQVQELVAMVDQPRGLVLEVHPSDLLTPTQAKVLVDGVLLDFGGGTVEVDGMRSRLIVWASPAAHARIRETLATLEAGLTQAGSVLRSYEIRHRPVDEVFRVVTEMLGQRALEAAASTGQQPLPASAAPVDRSREFERARHLSSSSASSGDGVREARLFTDEASNRLFAIVDHRQAAQLDALIEAADVAVREVLVEAAVIAISQSDLVSISTRLGVLRGDGGDGFQGDSGLGETLVEPGGALPIDGPGAGLSLVGLNAGEWSAVLQALSRRTSGQTTTLPRITVANNASATLTSTLETPYLAVNASDTVATTSFGGSLAAGTVLQVRPSVLSDERVLLEYRVSVSSFVGEPTSDGLPPPRQVSEFGSQLQLRSGEGGLVGGLVVQEAARSRSGVPLLSSIPLIGAFFGDRSRSSDDTRVFLLLRVSVVEAESKRDEKAGERRLVPMTRAELRGWWGD